MGKTMDIVESLVTTEDLHLIETRVDSGEGLTVAVLGCVSRLVETVYNGGCRYGDLKIHRSTGCALLDTSIAELTVTAMYKDWIYGRALELARTLGLGMYGGSESRFSVLYRSHSGESIVVVWRDREAYNAAYLSQTGIVKDGSISYVKLGRSIAARLSELVDLDIQVAGTFLP